MFNMIIILVFGGSRKRIKKFCLTTRDIYIYILGMKDERKSYNTNDNNNKKKIIINKHIKSAKWLIFVPSCTSLGALNKNLCDSCFANNVTDVEKGFFGISWNGNQVYIHDMYCTCFKGLFLFINNNDDNNINNNVNNNKNYLLKHHIFHFENFISELIKISCSYVLQSDIFGI